MDRTHSQSIEAMFAGVPGLNIVAPSHLLDPGDLLRRCVSPGNDPALFIENKLLCSQRLRVRKQGGIEAFFARGTNTCFPAIHLSLSDFETPDVTLIAYAGSVPFAMEARRPFADARRAALRRRGAELDRSPAAR